ncbi:MAG: ABC transporter substrate-binding protein [Chloroflexi bacterium]|nr:ABC transporter substrate-binding protein [Chloroflexota bacterium]
MDERRFGRRRVLPVTILLVLAALALALAAACGGDDDAEPVAAPAEPEPAAAAAEPEPAPAPEPEIMRAEVDVGILGSQSGPWVVLGETLHYALQMAAAEINSGHPTCVESGACEPGGGVLVGDTLYTINIHARDIRSENEAALAAAEELISDVGVRYMFGPVLDPFAILVQELTQPEGIIHFGSPSIFATVLTEESVAPGGEKHYLFKTLVEDAVWQAIVAKATTDTFPDATRQAILIGDDANGESIARGLQDAFELLGQEVEVVFYPPGETTDYSPFLTRIKAFEPDVVHFYYNPPEEQAALEQALELDVAPAYSAVNIDPLDFQEFFGTLEQDVLLVCVPVCVAGLTSPKIKDYFERYRQQAGELGPTASFSLMIYDFLPMLAAAWKHAGTVDDADAVVAALETIEYESTIGLLSFDDRHIVDAGLDSCLVSGGEFECTLITERPGLER